MQRKGAGPLLCMQVIEGAAEQRRFEALYAAYHRRMLALARRKLPTQEDAEDAVQQAFLALAEHFTRLAALPQPQLEAYLVVTVERKILDLLRARARHDGVPFDDTLPVVTPEPSGHPLADAMGRLSPRYREALLLRHAQGYTTQEVAEILELSYEAARKLLYRAKEALKKQLGKEGISI